MAVQFEKFAPASPESHVKVYGTSSDWNDVLILLNAYRAWKSEPDDHSAEEAQQKIAFLVQYAEEKVSRNSASTLVGGFTQDKFRKLTDVLIEFSEYCTDKERLISSCECPIPFERFEQLLKNCLETWALMERSWQRGDRRKIH
ncbi:MAG: hypothetical protein AAF720_02530 [Pseudomonadota bacterium]